MRPKLLDLFSGAGGVAMGYHRAGFDVVGVDIIPQPRYPFEFIQADAMNILEDRRFLAKFNAIHASPPCQAYSTLRWLHKTAQYPDLVPAVRQLLAAWGGTWVIENVPGSKLDTSTILCGSMFGLGAHCSDGKRHYLQRHRAFESNVFIMVPSCLHTGKPIGVYGNGGQGAPHPCRWRFVGKSSERREAMGIDWMTRYELSQAIPPAYTEFIGKALLNVLQLAAPERPA